MVTGTMGGHNAGREERSEARYHAWLEKSGTKPQGPPPPAATASRGEVAAYYKNWHGYPDDTPPGKTKYGACLIATEKLEWFEPSGKGPKPKCRGCQNNNVLNEFTEPQWVIVGGAGRKVCLLPACVQWLNGDKQEHHEKQRNAKKRALNVAGLFYEEKLSKTARQDIYVFPNVNTAVMCIDRALLDCKGSYRKAVSYRDCNEICVQMMPTSSRSSHTRRRSWPAT